MRTAVRRKAEFLINDDKMNVNLDILAVDRLAIKLQRSYFTRKALGNFEPVRVLPVASLL